MIRIIFILFFLVGCSAAVSPDQVDRSDVQFAQSVPIPDLPLAPTPTATPILGAQPNWERTFDHVFEIAQTNGYVSNRTAVIDSRTGQVAIAWIAWGFSSNEGTGWVWVATQNADGTWNPARSVNRTPVEKFFGGVSLDYLPTGDLLVVYGDHRKIMQETTSRDNGRTWSDPQALALAPVEMFPPVPPLTPTPIGETMVITEPVRPVPTPTTDVSDEFPGNPQRGGVTRLIADPDGGLHLLYMSGENGWGARYAYRAPHETGWRDRGKVQLGEHFRARLAVVKLSDGRIRRYLAVPTDRSNVTLRVWWSDDGTAWNETVLPTNRYFPEHIADGLSILAVPYQDTAIVAVAWSQYTKGGVFAAVSLDGGTTWSPQQERIAQHYENGPIFSAQYDGAWVRAGWNPALAYEPSTHHLVATWWEHPVYEEGTTRYSRTAMSIRPLNEQDWAYRSFHWDFHVAPNPQAPIRDARSDRPPYVVRSNQGGGVTINSPFEVAPIGMRGEIISSSDSRLHALLIVDERNKQRRLLWQPIRLRGIVERGAS